MFIGLHLQTTALPEGASASALLGTIADAITAAPHDPAPRCRIEREVLYADLHPAAEAVRIAIEGEHVTLHANTVTAGPGYHQHVVGLAERIADLLSAPWLPEGDTTGWRETRDDRALEREFHDWATAAAAQILELHAEGMSGFALALPAGVAYTHDGLVATQLGPRTEAWLIEARRDPAVAQDIFPWWSSAIDAAYFCGLALTEMWRTVRWRAPLTDEERAVQERVVTWIERAHGLDPEMQLPWAEQSELLTYLSEESLRATRAHLKAQSRAPARVGYRRQPVRLELSGGWYLTVPGELAERWEERGTWVGWDETRSIFFNSFTAQASDERAPLPTTDETLRRMPALDGDELLELEVGEIRGYAALST
ncbi:MAG TPA: hypothetical protein ENK57_06275, partial [Polyangiaceae bacterium]|nr:hypothetical protein [Polyangiaceae bacterium]